MASKIEWTQETWNPVIGCTKVSAGCQNCYAERMAYRQVCMGAARHEKFPDDNEDVWIAYSNVMDEDTHGWNGSVSLRPEILDKPQHWRKPRRIFICSMSDLFHEKVPFEFICRIFETIQNAGQHTYLILTKRAKEMKEFFQSCEDWDSSEWPNVHIGVTCENQKETWRAGILQDISACMRFISFEPLLSDITYIPMNIKNLHWAIIGCESGPKERECKLDWVYRLVSFFISHGVPIFVKQLNINGKVEKDISKFPKDLQIRQYPERK